MDDLKATYLQRISWLGRGIGILLTIAGAFFAIRGLITTIVGVIPGMITVLLGQFILHTGRQAKNWMDTNDKEAINRLLGSYSAFLLTNGIVMVIVLIFYIIFFLFFAD